MAQPLVLATNRRPLSGFFYGLLSGLTAVSAGWQLLIDHSPLNAWCVIAVLTGAVVTLQYLHRTRAFEDCPVSSLAVMGLCVTTQWTSLVAQTLSGAALTDGLRVPWITFPALLSIQLTAVLMHWAYRSLAVTQALRTALSSRVLMPLGAFKPISPAAIWTASLVGVLSLASGGAEIGDAGGKFFQALSFLAWLPAVIPIYYARHGKSYCSMHAQIPFLVGYVLLLVLIGMARNARSFMIVGPMQAALVLLIVGLRSSRPITPRLTAVLSIGLVLSGILVFAAKDLVTAMVVVRESRGTLTPGQMIQETILALGDRQKLQLYAESGKTAAEYEVYDENYLSNPMLARFSETKFHDNMFDILVNLNENERAEIARMTAIKIVTLLPQPVIDKLGLGVDKEQYFFSMGDVYRGMNEGEGYLGGYAIGSMWADTWAIFGPWSPLIAVAIFLAVFLLLDSLSLKSSDGWLILSPIAVCTAWNIFLYGLGSESLVNKVAFFLRGFPEKVVLYCLVAWIASRIFPWKGALVLAGSPQPSGGNEVVANTVRFHGTPRA